MTGAARRPRVVDLRASSEGHGAAASGAAGEAERAGAQGVAARVAHASPASEAPAAGWASAADAAGLADAIVAARLVCFPTDTVYGVGGAVSPEVAREIVAAKGRDEGKPLQVVFSTVEVLLATVPAGPGLAGAVRRLLPGPFTLLLPYPAGLDFPPPGHVTHEDAGGRERSVATIGVRVPRWPAGAAPLAGLPFPLLASSANRSGGEAPGSLDEVDPGLLAVCDLILDAGPVRGRASTVLDLSVYEETGRWRILRPGAAGEDDVAALLAGEHPAALERGA